MLETISEEKPKLLSRMLDKWTYADSNHKIMAAAVLSFLLSAVLVSSLFGSGTNGNLSTRISIPAPLLR